MTNVNSHINVEPLDTVRDAPANMLNEDAIKSDLNELRSQCMSEFHMPEDLIASKDVKAAQSSFGSYVELAEYKISCPR